MQFISLLHKLTCQQIVKLFTLLEPSADHFTPHHHSSRSADLQAVIPLKSTAVQFTSILHTSNQQIVKIFTALRSSTLHTTVDQQIIG